MLQRYKVRLADGTILTVDQDGLRAWLTDGKAAVHVPGTQEWRPLRQFLADEKSAARLARALVPPEPRRGPSPSPPAVPPPNAPFERAIGEPPLVQALADDTGAAGPPPPPWRDLGQVAGEAPVIRLKPLDGERPAPPRPEAPLESAPLERAIGEAPLVQALADDTSAAGASVPPWRDAGQVIGEAPAIRLKPLDDERPAPCEGRRTSTWDVEEAEEDRGERHDRLEGPLLQVLSTFGALLSRCLDPLTPLVRELPVIPRPTAAPWRVPERLRGWGAGLTGWLSRRADRSQPEPPLPPSEPEARRPPAPAAARPLAPPTPVNELPVLRFADVQESREEEDLYEGETSPGSFSTLWLWTKRIVLLGGLVAGGVLAVLNWQDWFPRAAEVGHTTFTEIDRQVRAGQRAREQERALSDATERLPHLAPATIRLVLSASDSGVLEPPEVFQVASEAADRGQNALTPAEAAELRTLQRELLGHLRPPERARVAEYDRARANRVVFPFENPHTLELVARGARAMPAQSRERLQELLGKAVAAGLAPTAGPPGGRSR